MSGLIKLIENFCIYLKNVNFSAFNCIVCSNSVLYIVDYTNTKYPTVTSYDLYTMLNIQLLQYVMLQSRLQLQYWMDRY